MNKRRSRRSQSASGVTSIYALVDPRDSRLHYVGSAVKSYTLQHRLGRHIVDSRQQKKPNPSLKAWLKELALLGLKPLAVEIEETASEIGEAREEHWIEKLHSAGAPLLNRRYICSRRCPQCKAFSVAEIDGVKYCIDCDWTSEFD